MNPVRAGITDELLTSDFTSIQARLRRIMQTEPDDPPKPPLMPFGEGERQDLNHATLPCHFRDYVQLLEWYGRARHPRKRGKLNDQKPSLLWQLGLSARQWELLSREIQKEASTMMRGLDKVILLEQHLVKAKAA